MSCFFDNNGRPAGIDSFNFIRDLQWNNMAKKIEAIPVHAFNGLDPLVDIRLFLYPPDPPRLSWLQSVPVLVEQKLNSK